MGRRVDQLIRVKSGRPLGVTFCSSSRVSRHVHHTIVGSGQITLPSIGLVAA